MYFIYTVAKFTNEHNGMIFVHGRFGDDRRTGRKNGMKERRTGKRRNDNRRNREKHTRGGGRGRMERGETRK